MAAKVEYLEIRNSICSMACPDRYLVQIKYKFHREIDSNRLYDRITTLPYLIRILEKRDVLNIACIDAFRLIAKMLNNKRVDALIEGYGKAKQHVIAPPPAAVHRPVLGPIPSENLNNMRVSAHHMENNPVIPLLDSDPLVRVKDLICSDIGKKWKDLARAIGVREGEIDLLEERYPRISDRVQEVLRFHEQKNGNSKWKLCNALDIARRKDLRMEIQEIFEEHNMM
ncbi:unnamed protein product [Phaedon cochleariae]|uniref:Death domain-containing protein n=1 Tax=Phaedon cochleariae TaxID=80249 RepID=A0A9P0GNS3_PHACE|nr:unnamed protein product [Phaedon cochleariae]